MGINTSSKNIIWQATNVSTRELRLMVIHNMGNSLTESINIDVDVSNVAHILSSRCTTYEDLVNATAIYLRNLAKKDWIHCYWSVGW